MQHYPELYDWHKDNKHENLKCRNILDWIFECNRPIGVFRNIYRYGNNKSCEVSMSTFNLCMKLKYKKKEEAEQELNLLYPLIPKDNDIWKIRPEFYAGNCSDSKVNSSEPVCTDSKN